LTNTARVCSMCNSRQFHERKQMNTENELIELTMTTGAKLVARAASIEDVEGGLTGKLEDGRNFWVATPNLSHIVEVV